MIDKVHEWMNVDGTKASFDPAMLDGDTRDAMKQVDADFLDRRCERNPQVAEMRERTHKTLRSKNQAQRDLADRIVAENRRRARGLHEWLDRPQTAQKKADKEKRALIAAFQDPGGLLTVFY